MKRIIYLTLSTFALSLLLLILPGCVPSQREWEISLAADSPVVLQMRVDVDERSAGYVAHITQENGSRRASLRITDSSARKAFRTGIEVLPHNGESVRLSTSRCAANAPPLAAGAVIPDRSLVAQVLTSASSTARDMVWSIRDFAVDHPLVGVAGALVVALFVFWLVGKLLKPRAVLLLLILVLLMSAIMAAHADTLGFRASDMEAEQKAAAFLLSGARASLDQAGSPASIGDSSKVERLCIEVRLIRLQFAIKMTGHEGRVQAIRSQPLSYARKNKIEAFLASASELRDRDHRIGAELDALISLQGVTTNAWYGYRYFERNQKKLQDQFTTGTVSCADLLRDLHDLEFIPPALILSRMVVSSTAAGWDPTAAGNWRSPAGAEFRPDGEAVLITNTQVLTKISTNTVFHTNVVRIAIPPVTNLITRTQQVLVHHTNTVIVISNSPPPMAAVSLPASTNLTESASVQDAVTNISASVGGTDPGVAGPTSDADGGRTPPASSPGSAASHPFGWTQARWLIAVVAVVGLLALAFGRRLMTAEPLEISLLVNGREQVFCLSAGEALFLGREVFSDFSKADHSAYRLTPKGSTLWLRPPSGMPAGLSIRVNQAETSLPRPLVPEDVVSITTDKQEMVVKFLSCASPVFGVDEALQDAPAN